MYEFTVTENESSKRLDLFLTEKLPEYSRSALAKMIAEELVWVNGKLQKANYKTCLNDRITVTPPEPVDLDVKPEDIPLNILFEDKHLIVLNKPQGTVVHPAPGHYSGTLVNALLYHCKGQLSGINGVMRPGIVHRIDKDTSGVLVVAKTEQAHKDLALQLAEHSITRVYNALVYNNVKKDKGSISAPIGRNPKDRLKMAIVPTGKPAVTHYSVLERLGKYTHVELRLETGRTHQIRVHMTSLGHPLLGDSVYGSANNVFKLQGQALHARILGFIHPTENKYMEFEAPLPDYFESLLQKLREI